MLVILFCKKIETFEKLKHLFSIYNCALPAFKLSAMAGNLWLSSVGWWRPGDNRQVVKCVKSVVWRLQVVSLQPAQRQQISGAKIATQTNWHGAKNWIKRQSIRWHAKTGGSFLRRKLSQIHYKRSQKVKVVGYKSISTWLFYSADHQISRHSIRLLLGSSGPQEQLFNQLVPLSGGIW